MKLIALTCDKASFQPLIFRPQGLSIIVGDAAEREGSANGVGKTLALRLVHHCLGARRDSTIAQGVGKWRFALEFELTDGTHRIERNGDGSDISLDGQSKTERQLLAWLDERGPFVLPKDPQESKWLSFRALYRRFARRERDDCSDPVRLGQELAHEALARTLYLLGADVSLVLRKASLRERWLEIDDQLKLIKSADARLRELLASGMSVQTQIDDLHERIQALQQRLDQMQIAEDYEAIRQEADALTARIRAIETRMAQIDFQLAGIERMLARRPDVTREALLGFYEGLQHVFRPEALARFQDVEQFHRSLAEQRERRLNRDKVQLENERQSLQAQRQEVARRRDAALAFLGQRHAIGDYMAVAERLAIMRADLERLRRYGDVQTRLNEERLQLSELMVKDNQRANDYIQSRPLEWADRIYRDLIRSLYPNEAAGISLVNDTGNNKQRYQLKVEVQGQGSDGINAVRVMAFDWLIYRHGAHHAMRHLWHDNRLFDHVDPNQRAAWLRRVSAELARSDMQYIVSINTENFESARAQLNGEASILDEAVIVRLRGDEDRHKLLGVRIGVA